MKLMMKLDDSSYGVITYDMFYIKPTKYFNEELSCSCCKFSGTCDKWLEGEYDDCMYLCDSFKPDLIV